MPSTTTASSTGYSYFVPEALLIESERTVSASHRAQDRATAVEMVMKGNAPIIVDSKGIATELRTLWTFEMVPDLADFLSRMNYRLSPLPASGPSPEKPTSDDHYSMMVVTFDDLEDAALYKLRYL